MLIGIDLITSFLFGIIIAFISVIVSSLFKNKTISVISILLIYAFLSYFNINAPLLYLHSIFNYFNYYVEDVYSLNVYTPLLISSVYLIITFVLAKIILKRKIDGNI